MTVFRNNKGRFRTPTAAEKDVDIRSEGDAKRLEAMLKSGAPTFVLIYADWCGHCHRYLPMWSQFENTPGRTANMARVHYDMQDKIPAIKDAKIQGYPSVIKVLPDGRIQSYAADGGATNAIPFMRDEGEMHSELQGANNGATSAPNSAMTTNQSGGGDVLGAFTSAIQRAGPAALLILASAALHGRKAVATTKPTSRGRTYKTPKRASRRASTRRRRRA